MAALTPKVVMRSSWIVSDIGSGSAWKASCSRARLTDPVAPYTAAIEMRKSIELSMLTTT